MIPTTTGAAKSVAEVIPELKGKLNGISMRVPTPNVSVVDFTVVLGKKASVEEINAAMKKASQGSLKNILAYADEPTVSVDYNGDPHSSIFDSTNTYVIDDLAKVLAWYDNEWGFSNRMVDLSLYVGSKL
jgi:glyceraldehyde 3-phosphate dehydrogenase